MKKNLLAILALLLLSSCYSFHVDKVINKDFVNKSLHKYPVAIKLDGISWTIPRGAVVGYQKRTLTCQNPGNLYWRSAREMIKDIELQDVFFEELSLKGYDVTGNPNQMYVREDDNARAKYTIGAQIRGIRLNICNKVEFLTFTDYGEKGEASINIHWQVYSPYKKDIVYETDTSGYAKIDNANPYGIAILLKESFASASLALANKEDFQKLIFIKDKPMKEKDLGKWPFEELSFKKIQKSNKYIKDHSLDIRKASVIIRSASGHGTGFFISDDGYILTNHHVIGDSEEIIIEDYKGHKKKANIIREHKFRDIALLKLEDTKGLEIIPLAIRKKLAEIGEDVYVIGNPLEEKSLQNTLTKGTISAWRDYIYDSTYIQSDVAIHPGNSGGPLMDKYGNVLGVAVKGKISKGYGVGLNLFIPIHEALDKLNITFY